MGLGELKAKIEYESRLIKEVKKRNILYDPIYREDKNVAAKDKQWQEIANILGESVPALKSRWAKLCDRYHRMRCHLKESNLSDSRSANPSKWIHFEGMNFLCEHDMDESPINDRISPDGDLNATTNSFYIPNIDPFDKDMSLDTHIIEDSSVSHLDLSYDNVDDSIVEDFVLPQKLDFVPELQQGNEATRTTPNASYSGATISRKRKYPDNYQNDIEILLNKLTCIVDSAASTQNPAVLGTHKLFASLADKVLAAKLSPELQMQLERETLDFVYTKLHNIQVNKASKLF